MDSYPLLVLQVRQQKVRTILLFTDTAAILNSQGQVFEGKGALARDVFAARTATVALFELFSSRTSVHTTRISC